MFFEGDSMSFKENMTYEKKTTYGIVGIVIGILFWGIGQPYIGIMDILLLILPCIFLAIPSQTTKNSKALAIISIILLVLAFFVLIFGYYYNPLSPILQLILCIYGFFCAYVMTIQTSPKQILANSSNMNAINNQKYDKYCSKCGQGLFNDSQFCSKCGTKVSNDIPEDSSEDNNEEITDKQCTECGQELHDDSKFCPECGAEVTKDISEDSLKDDEEETTAKECSECGQELHDDSKFCPECGAEASPSEEEKLE